MVYLVMMSCSVAISGYPLDSASVTRLSVLWLVIGIFQLFRVDVEVTLEIFTAPPVGMGAMMQQGAFHTNLPLHRIFYVLGIREV